MSLYTLTAVLEMFDTVLYLISLEQLKISD